MVGDFIKQVLRIVPEGFPIALWTPSDAHPCYLILIGGFLVTGRDASLPAPLLCTFGILVARGTVVALPQTPAGTLSLHPARGNLPLDPFARLSWFLYHNPSMCLSDYSIRASPNATTALTTFPVPTIRNGFNTKNSGSALQSPIHLGSVVIPPTTAISIATENSSSPT